MRATSAQQRRFRTGLRQEMPQQRSTSVGVRRSQWQPANAHWSQRLAEARKRRPAKSIEEAVARSFSTSSTRTARRVGFDPDSASRPDEHLERLSAITGARGPECCSQVKEYRQVNLGPEPGATSARIPRRVTVGLTRNVLESCIALDLAAADKSGDFPGADLSMDPQPDHWKAMPVRPFLQQLLYSGRNEVWISVGIGPWRVADLAL